MATPIPPPPPAVPPVERRHYPRRYRRALRAMIGLVVIMALTGVGVVAWRHIGGPGLDSVTPARAEEGDTIVLGGTGFSSRVEDNMVVLGEYTARVLKASSNELQVEVPDIGLLPGERLRAPVHVQVGEEESVTLDFEILPGPPEPGTEAPPDPELLPGGVPPPGAEPPPGATGTPPQPPPSRASPSPTSRRPSPRPPSPAP